MRVALTVWGDRLSPVYDSARQFLIAEIKKGEIINCWTIKPEWEDPRSSVRQLKELEVVVVICGAISSYPAKLLKGQKISVIPFLSGYSQSILNDFANGATLTHKYAMPGCRKRCCKRDRFSLKEQ